MAIKTKGPAAGAWNASLPFVTAMSIIFPLGIPLYYVLKLLKVKNVINPSLRCILKDSDYVTAFAVAGHQFKDRNGVHLTGMALEQAKAAETVVWVQNNPELAASLRGKDYRSQYEQMRTRLGFKKAKAFIAGKARAASVPAHRFKFLWGPYRVVRTFAFWLAAFSLTLLIFVCRTFGISRSLT